MIQQNIFNFDIKKNLSIEDFFLSDSNIEAYKYVINDNDLIKHTVIYGPPKSGKTHLGLIWKKNNDAIIFDNNIDEILNNKKNIFIDDYDLITDEETLFHIINHTYNNNIKILLCTGKILDIINYKLKDLISRLKSFHLIKIKIPDDELVVNLINKLLHERQIIINNPEIFSYILNRIDRSYEKIFQLVEKIDKFSLQKKRELTIPLIRELI